MKDLSKKDDRARKLRSFRRHSFLLLRAFLLSLPPLFFWHEFRLHGIHFASEDELSIVGGAIAFMGIAYGIMASLVLGSIWEKYRKVVVAVLRRDRETFLYYRDERIPVMIHLLLASLSLPFLAMIMLLPYQYMWSGIASVFSVSFILSLYWIVATELENPAKSPWFAERIPPEWLTVDIDEHFSLDRDQKGDGHTLPRSPGHDHRI